MSFSVQFPLESMYTRRKLHVYGEVGCAKVQKTATKSKMVDILWRKLLLQETFFCATYVRSSFIAVAHTRGWGCSLGGAIETLCQAHLHNTCQFVENS